MIRFFWLDRSATSECRQRSLSIWARDGGKDIKKGIIHAFIVAVTVVVVVAIPEGLPLAVVGDLAGVLLEEDERRPVLHPRAGRMRDHGQRHDHLLGGLLRRDYLLARHF